MKNNNTTNAWLSEPNLHNSNDSDLQALFKAHKTEIADSGFSRKVAQKLPADNIFYTVTYCIWAFAAVLIVFVALHLFNFRENFPLAIEFFTKELNLFFQSPKIYVSVFLIILTAGIFWFYKKMAL